MTIHIQFEAQLRTVAGRTHLALDVPDGGSLADALRLAGTEQIPALKAHLLSGAGGVRGSLLMFVGDRPVRADEAARLALKDGDRIVLLPPISGG